MPVLNQKQELAKKADLLTKQDILTPGTGITIQNNVISATGTGGSTVTVTPVLSTGTRIAAIEVDGTIYTLFAPTPPSVSVTQIQQSGVELARVTIDNTPYSIYAPEGSTVLSGTSAPTAAQGENGDLYVQYTVTSGVYTVNMTYVKLSGAWVELSAGGGGGLPENWTVTDEYIRGKVKDLNELGWAVQNPTYYIDTQATWSYGGSTFTKTNAKPAIGVVVKKLSKYYTILMSTDTTAIAFTNSGAYPVSYSYLGMTWYYTTDQGISSISNLEGINFYSEVGSIVDAIPGIMNVCEIYTNEYSNKFTQISTPVTGHLFTGGGSQANLSDATFDVESDGTIHGKELKVSDDVKINNVSVLNNFTGATSSTAGAKGMVPAPTTSDYQKYLKGDGTWDAINPFTGATDQANGSAGIVPAPLIADKDKFLKGDGTWAEAGGNVDDVQVNGTSVLDSNKIAQITSYREVTQAEYDALPASKKSDGVLYCIKDQTTADTTVAPIIYSTDEREIGVWTDGKPLYQKTFSISNITVDSWQSITHSISNLSEVVKFGGDFQRNSDGNIFSVPYIEAGSVYIAVQVSSTLIYYRVNGITTGKINITIQYTKTTDAPGSGKWAPSGVPAVHYSENEQVVGTWVDGSTVYERVIEYTTPFTIANGSWYTSTESYTGISKIVNAWIINESGAIYNGTIVVIENDKLVIGNQTKDQPINNLKYVIIQYTKTT